MLAGELNTAMIIGKGSLFLGRMTNLFDGVSFVMRKNSGEVDEGGVSTEKVKKLIAESFRQFAATLAADDE